MAHTRFVPLSRIAVGLAASMMWLAGPARAQSTTADTTGSQQQFEAVSDPGPQTPTPPIPTVQPVTVAQPQWSGVAGFEADTHNTGYGFAGPAYMKPVRRNVGLVAGGDVNYLYYEFASATDRTVVHSPGVSLFGGVKLGGENYVMLTAGPTIKRQHSELRDPLDNVLSSSERTIYGMNLGTEVWVDPTKHNNVYAIADYTTSDGYLWSRLAYKEQLANRNWDGKFTPYLGIEGVAQGNHDVRSTQFGPFIEVVHVPSSLSIMLRGGWKRSTYQVGPEKTGPWFAIGFWRRL